MSLTNSDINQLAEEYQIYKSKIGQLKKVHSKLKEKLEKICKQYGKKDIVKTKRYMISLKQYPSERLTSKEDLIKYFGLKKMRPFIRTVMNIKIDIKRIGRSS